MKSSVQDVIPLKMRRAIIRFGSDLAMARRKRRLTAAMMAERVGVSKSTYARIEKGDSAVAMGAYAMALHVLGLGDSLFSLADPGQDETGLLLDREQVPKRVRPVKNTGLL